MLLCSLEEEFSDYKLLGAGGTRGGTHDWVYCLSERYTFVFTRPSVTFFFLHVALLVCIYILIVIFLLEP